MECNSALTIKVQIGGEILTEFKIVQSDDGDWMALYMSGKLIAEGHNLNASAVLDAISDVFPNNIKYIEVSSEVAEMGMPENILELEEKKDDK